MPKPLTSLGNVARPAAAGQVVRLRHGLNETVNWRQFAAGPHREPLAARFRELHTHAVRLLVFDKGAPNPVGDWEPFAACVRAVLGAGAVPMVTFAKFGFQPFWSDWIWRAMEREVERKLGLVPSGNGGPVPTDEVEVVFRVYLSDRPVPRAVCIAGTHPKLGDRVPNRVHLYDDGTHGDQKAGDGVWSLGATFPAEKELHYVYTNSGREGEWEGLDVPHIREIQVEPKDEGKRVHLPVETFGKIYMQADGWHPNAAGYDLIARAVCEVLKQDEKVKASVRR